MMMRSMERSRVSGKATSAAQLTWPTTSIRAAQSNDLSRVLTALTKYPEDFVPHPTVQKVLDKRREMALGKRAPRLGGS